MPRWFSFITLFTYPSQAVFTENLLRARLPITDWKPREEQKASLYLEESMVEVEVVGGNHREPQRSVDSWMEQGCTRRQVEDLKPLHSSTSPA